MKVEREFTIYEGTPYHAAFPDVERAPNGDILVVFRLGSAHVWGRDGRIYLSRSKDGGNSWETREIINSPERFVKYQGEYRPLSDDRDPSIRALSNGKIILSWFHWGDGDRDNPTSSVYISTSGDNGYTWEEPQRVFFNAATSDKILEMEEGLLFLPAYGSLKGGYSSAFLIISEDYGDSWAERPIVIVDGNKYEINFYEPTIAKVDEKELISVLRTDLGLLYISRSKDQGATWSEPEPLPLYGQAPYLLMLSNGKLLLSFRDTELYFKERWFWEKLLYNLGLRDIRPTSPLPKSKILPEATAIVEASPPEYKFECDRKKVIYEPKGFITDDGDILFGDSGYPSMIELEENKVLTVLYEAPYGYGGRYAPWSRIVGVTVSLEKEKT
ncbi:MAG: hypothetical protein PWQ16_258 [bacterium]|nr:MAG: hypothetical protein XD52_1394 [bacterium 42_11]MDK2870906.1 hypothetical protein [bacterium]